jgi:RNA polymerase sigma factor (TIGR02999 family)
MASQDHDITELLLQWSQGDEVALEKLTPLIYGELRRIAKFHMKRQQPGHTLQATALANEAFMRLVHLKDITWEGRAHFFAVAAQAMRHILIDHARRYKSSKRGGDSITLSLDDVAVLAQEQASEMLALDDALKSLAELDAKKAKIVELRFFGGLDAEETAAVVHLSVPAIRREWRLAKAWLYRELKRA